MNKQSINGIYGLFQELEVIDLEVLKIRLEALIEEKEWLKKKEEISDEIEKDFNMKVN